MQLMPTNPNMLSSFLNHLICHSNYMPTPINFLWREQLFMKELFKYAKIDKIIRLSLQISVVLLLCAFIYSVFSYFSLPPLLPLFNQLPWGEERLGQRFEIFLPSLI